jgi:hypothetical protein
MRPALVVLNTCLFLRFLLVVLRRCQIIANTGELTKIFSLSFSDMFQIIPRIQSTTTAAIIYATHSIWGGHHHVEVHNTDWWIAKFQSFGFVYNDALTQQIKNAASASKWCPTPNAIADDGQLTCEENHKSERYQAQHLWTHLMVFINPAVASLPKHNHLLAEHGCYNPYTRDTPGVLGHRKCGDPTLPDLHESLVQTAKAEMALPDDYLALPLTTEQDEKWEKRIFGKTTAQATAEWNSKNKGS